MPRKASDAKSSKYGTLQLVSNKNMKPTESNSTSKATKQSKITDLLRFPRKAKAESSPAQHHGSSSSSWQGLALSNAAVQSKREPDVSSPASMTPKPSGGVKSWTPDHQSQTNSTPDTVPRRLTVLGVLSKPSAGGVARRNRLQLKRKVSPSKLATTSSKDAVGSQAINPAVTSRTSAVESPTSGDEVLLIDDAEMHGDGLESSKRKHRGDESVVSAERNGSERSSQETSGSPQMVAGKRKRLRRCVASSDEGGDLSDGEIPASQSPILCQTEITDPVFSDGERETQKLAHNNPANGRPSLRQMPSLGRGCKTPYAALRKDSRRLFSSRPTNDIHHTERVQAPSHPLQRPCVDAHAADMTNADEEEFRPAESARRTLAEEEEDDPDDLGEFARPSQCFYPHSEDDSDANGLEPRHPDKDKSLQTPSSIIQPGLVRQSTANSRIAPPIAPSTSVQSVHRAAQIGRIPAAPTQLAVSSKAQTLGTSSRMPAAGMEPQRSRHERSTVGTGEHTSRDDNGTARRPKTSCWGLVGGAPDEELMEFSSDGEKDEGHHVPPGGEEDVIDLEEPELHEIAPFFQPLSDADIARKRAAQHEPIARSRGAASAAGGGGAVGGQRAKSVQGMSGQAQRFLSSVDRAERATGGEDSDGDEGWEHEASRASNSRRGGKRGYWITERFGALQHQFKRVFVDGNGNKLQGNAAWAAAKASGVSGGKGKQAASKAKQGGARFKFKSKGRWEKSSTAKSKAAPGAAKKGASKAKGKGKVKKEAKAKSKR